jgi:hypothetical protein
MGTHEVSRCRHQELGSNEAKSPAAPGMRGYAARRQPRERAGEEQT